MEAKSKQQPPRASAPQLPTSMMSEDRKHRVSSDFVSRYPLSSTSQALFRRV
jgi:hypothetical protein